MKMGTACVCVSIISRLICYSFLLTHHINAVFLMLNAAWVVMEERNPQHVTFVKKECFYSRLQDCYYPLNRIAGTGSFKVVAGLSLRDKIRNICRELEAESQLLCIERSRLRYFWHLIRKPPFRGAPTTSTWEGASG